MKFIFFYIYFYWIYFLLNFFKVYFKIFPILNDTENSSVTHINPKNYSLKFKSNYSPKNIKNKNIQIQIKFSHKNKTKFIWRGIENEENAKNWISILNFDGFSSEFFTFDSHPQIFYEEKFFVSYTQFPFQFLRVWMILITFWCFVDFIQIIIDFLCSIVQKF